jgi:DNA invertase Pin-like site-specific DNA recombinase
MAGLLAVFDEFEHEILRERCRAGFAHARQNGTAWDDRSRRYSELVKSASYIMLAISKAPSLAGRRSAALSIRRILAQRSDSLG